MPPLPAIKLEQFGHTEKEWYFHSGSFRRVGSVNGVSLDILGEMFSNGTFGRICGVCSAHHVAPMFDGVVALDHQDDHRALRHKCYESPEERLLAMDFIESLGLLLGQPYHFHTANPEAGLFDHSENLTGVAA